MASRETQGIGTRTVRGIMWGYGSFIGGRALSLIATAILARILTPKDFGLVALALSFMVFLDLFQGSGVSLALVVGDEADVAEQADTAFALTTGLGIVLALLTAAVGPLAATFFHQPRLVAIAPVLGLNFFFIGLGGTHAALAQKRIDFRSRTVAELAEAGVRGVIGVVLAVVGAGVWSLVIGYILGTAAWCATLFYLIPWRPQFRPRRRHLRHLLSFGGSLSGVNIMAAFMAQFDNIVVGRVLGAVQLGFYSIATRLPQLLILNLASIAGRVLFPAFASLEERDMERGFLTALRYALMVSLPLTVFMLVFAEPLTVALFGGRWRNAGASMQVLCIWALMTVLGTIWGNAFLARRRPDIILKLAVPQAIALIAGSLLFVHQGIVAVSWVQAGIAIAAQIAVIWIAQHMFGFSFAAAARACAPPVIASAGLAVPLLAIHHLISQRWPALVAGVGVGAVVYLGLVQLITPDAFRRLRATALPASRAKPEPTPTRVPTRLVGVAIPDVSDWREPLPNGKWSQLFAALARQTTLVDIIQPTPTRQQQLLNLALSFHPRLSKWRMRAAFNLRQARRISSIVERELSRRAGSYDLVLQLQTLCSPGDLPGDRRYVIYTDNTYALTHRLYSRGEPRSAPRVQRRLAFEAAICRSAMFVFTASEFARRSMIEDYGCSPSRVAAVGAGANQMLPSIDGKRYDTPRALFVGVEFERKGGPTLLQAFSAVRERLPAAELLVVGPRTPPPEHLGPGVKWLGRVDRARLRQLYADASVFVLPSIFEPWGFVFAEAMGHGLPCIGTTCCAMPELIEEGVTGLLVPRGEAGPLADALVELLADPRRLEQMGHAAHARALGGLTWDHVADRVASHLAGSGLSANGR
jgi:O-antigen/teichoic acid export membrane protein/glycosyltransferase involved in cell wall biosynthesis